VLEDLLDLIAQKDSSLEDWREALQRMTPFAVETRYPEFSIPSWEGARQAVETASAISDFIKTILPGHCLP
jgi:HEPN domain-containing protein